MTSQALRLRAGRNVGGISLRIPRWDVAWLLAGLTILAQICYPLTSGATLDALTVVTVLLFAAATLTQVTLSRGAQDALRLLLFAGSLGFAAEALGVHTGIPFGHYAYTGNLGPEVFAVPAVIPFAWVMMSWPALCVGRRIGHPIAGGALALASWDVFLDPQMVHDGHWVWHASGPRLTGIPLTNYLGWVGVSFVVVAVIHRALPERETLDDAQPLALWLWTWTSSILANLAFFHRPLVAVVGGAAMAGAGVPLIFALRRTATRATP